MAIHNVRKNIHINVQGKTLKAEAGSKDPFERTITVSNRGREDANVQLFIQPTDSFSEALSQWEYKFSEKMPFLIKAGKEKDVTLSFRIPQSADPGSYQYEICVQDPNFQNDIERRSQQVQVLASRQYIESFNEPRITIDPFTSSDQPYLLKHNEKYEVKIDIENRSSQVDRFSLSCPELEPDWFKVEYPRDFSTGTGFVQQSDGLKLSPKETGTIILALKPPHHTLAGHYSSTLRVSSKVRNDLVLLDIIYFKISLDNSLIISHLTPLSRDVLSPSRHFEFQIENPGNIRREINLIASDEQNLFRYQVEPSNFQLSPSEKRSIQLIPKQTRRSLLKRSWTGKDLEVPFQVYIQGTEIEPKLRDGTLILRSRPKWLFWMLIGIPLVIIILSALYGLWRVLDWSIQKFVIDPSLQPKLLDVTATKQAYQEGKDDPIRLNWSIKNPEQLSSVKITTRYPEAQETQLSYSFSQPITDAQGNQCSKLLAPPESSVFWSVLTSLYPKKLDKPSYVLRCQGIIAQEPFLEKSPGKYEVTVDMFTRDSEDSAISQAKTGLFRILCWTGLKPSFSGCLDERLHKDPIIPDKTVEKLTTTFVVKDIQVTQAPAPVIAQFAAKMPVYRVADLASGADATRSNEPLLPVQLNWSVINFKALSALKLQIFHTRLDGSSKVEEKAYTLQNGKLVGLENVCQEKNRILNCQDVPIAVTEPGQYKFLLSAILQDSRRQVADINTLMKSTEIIQVKPPLPKILGLQIDGQDTLNSPKRIFLINPLQGPTSASISWQVQNPETMKIELLPAPGVIERSQLNKITYPLSPNPGSSAITLRVTNVVGEMVERTVLLETSVIPDLPLPIPPQRTGASLSSPSSPQPPSQALPVPGYPSNPNELQPFELPPRTN
jgi:hypothetical protein